MKKFQKSVAFTVVLLLLFNLIPNVNPMKVYAEEAPPAVTLVGDFMEGNDLGKNWDPGNEATLMTYYSEGMYEIKVNFKNSGKYSYKVALNKNWDEAYPKDNKAIQVTSGSTVTFIFDNNSKKVYDSVNEAGNFKEFATITGTLGQAGGQDWNPEDTKFDLEYVGGGFFKKTFNLKAGNYEYKAAYDHKWTNGEVSDNIKFNISEDKDVTFMANPFLNLCKDSINNPEIAEGGSGPSEDDVVSPEINADGTITFRYKASDSAKEVYLAGDMTNWQDGKKAMAKGEDNVYSITIDKLAAGKHAYKFIVDGNWLRDPANTKTIGENSALFVPGFYSIDVPAQVKHGETVTCSALSLTAEGSDEVISGVSWSASPEDAASIDENGILTANLLKDGEDSKKVTVTASKDGITISKDLDIVREISEVPGGKIVVLVGTIQGAVGASDWAPSDYRTRMPYKGNNRYELTLKNVPAGSYEYKVALDGGWGENYGAGGEKGGANIPLSVNETKDITFIYSDVSHRIVDTTTYIAVNAQLTGTGIPENTVMKDEDLTGVYSAKVSLSKGSYDDLAVLIGEETINIPTINIEEDLKEVTISYDSLSGMVFNDCSNKKIDESSTLYNSRELEYKTPYGAVPVNTKVTFNLKAAKDDLTEAKLMLITSDGNKAIEMEKSGSFEGGSDKWTAEYTPNKVGMNKYYFVLSNGSEVKAYGDDDGYFGSGKLDNLGSIKLYDLNVYESDFKTPDWMKNGIAYQIFPDRFYNGDRENDTAQTIARGSTNYEFYKDWYAIPEDPEIENDPSYAGTKGDGIWCNEIYGGDIKGITGKLDYLKALGVNVLYLNPISHSISNHRYDTTDYRNVDPILGNMDDFVKLAEEAQKRGMNIILDGVFNHVSDDSIYFDRYGKYAAAGKPLGAYEYWSKVYDLMNNDEMDKESAEAKVQLDYKSQGITDFHYKDWFAINNKLVGEGNEKHYDYEGWWGYDSMPVIQSLNGSEYNVKTWADEIIDGPDSNSRYWLKNGSDGWRLDVANEVSDETWRKFRTAVKSEGDNVIIGEIWTDASKYILGDMYDSVMNYRFRDSVMNFVKGKNEDGEDISAKQSVNELEAMREQYPREAFEAMLNLVDSHDTQRAISNIDGAKKSKKGVAKEPSKEALERMKLIPLIQMTYPGTPCIYYGDEAGIPGCDDPDNRRGMIWGKGNKELVEWYAKLANIRDNYEVLRTGDIKFVDIDSDDMMAYLRTDDNNKALVLVNRGDENNIQLNVKDMFSDGTLSDAITGQTYEIKDGILNASVPSKSGLILVKDYKEVKVNTEALKDAYDPSFIVEPDTPPYNPPTDTEPYVNKLTISSNKSEIFPGEEVTFTAAAEYSDGKTQDATDKASWTCDHGTINKGIYKADKDYAGKVTVKAVFEGKTAEKTIEVKKANVKELMLQVNRSVIGVKKNDALKVVAKMEDGSTRDITENVEWVVSDDKIGYVEGRLLKAKAAGTVKIYAKYGDIKSNEVTVKVITEAEEDKPKGKLPSVGFVGIMNSEAKFGEKQKLTFTSKNYSGKVQYKVFYIQRDRNEVIDASKWSVLTDWTEPVDASQPFEIEIPETLASKPAKYDFAVRVKAAGTEGTVENKYGGFDDAYLFNYVFKSESNANADAVKIDKVEAKVGEKVTITGNEGVNYRLFTFKEGRKDRWDSSPVSVGSTLDWTPEEAGDYVLDVQVMDGNNVAAWKLITVKVVEP